jgi:hypothetical protein
MHRAPGIAFEDSSPRKSSIRPLLAALRHSHEQLITEMATLDALTEEKNPDRLRYSQVRWRLSRASLTRRNLSARICADLDSLVGQSDRLTLKEIRNADCELARNSAVHVGQWPADSIDTNWPDYCDASREIRRRMEAYLDLERRLLFPLLERAVAAEPKV